MHAAFCSSIYGLLFYLFRFTSLVSLKCRELHAIVDASKSRWFDVLQSTVGNVQVGLRQQVLQLLARQRTVTSADQGRSVQAEV